jgi:hypothetical protein
MISNTFLRLFVSGNSPSPALIPFHAASSGIWTDLHLPLVQIKDTDLSARCEYLAPYWPASSYLFISQYCQFDALI